MGAIPSLAALQSAGPDEKLFERMREGDRDAFAALTARYWAAVHRIAANMLPEASRAGEIAEEAFLQALRAPGWFPRDAPFHVSLYRLAIVLSLIRRRPGRDSGPDSLLPRFDASGRLIAPAAAEDELALRRDMAERIREGLDHVEELDRAAFVLHVIEEVPLEDAAVILRTSAETIRDRAHRACLVLTGFLRRLGVAGAPATPQEP